MRNLQRGALAAFLSMTMLSPAAADDEKSLNVYNWSDYIGPTTVADFEKETGIKVNYDVFDSNEVLEAKLLAGSSNYDVVVPSAQFLERQVKAGAYMELDRSKLENFGDLDPVLMKQLALNDPGNAYSVPYLWGAIGIGYNKAMIKERLGTDKIDSLDVIFKPENASKLADCGLTLLDSPSEIMATANVYLGIDANSENPKDLEKAVELLKGVRPHVRYFHSSQFINDLANGAVCITLGYAGDMVNARERAQAANNGVDLAIIVPKEGGILFFDVMAIPKDAPHPENAYAFINYISRPEVMASLSNSINFPNVSLAADPMISEEVRNDPGAYPPMELRDKLYAMKAHSLKFDRLLTRAWTEIKTGQ
ncbi:polyamine ABC transporter substrate-binding protein [Mycoplana dimorpha]|uniref:Putrescine-binding periplasmic protein n=1 Tax=Mycoplana dimorpha TaxID=28320 RepID=A0A2T5B399_MYCDI|nr:polyamine ABC transporter substrate-binding protein [Mycoplana dimorpha]PTM93449.1 spermidine/putrescine-binding protein [Mycoplana dimorpha]